MFSGVITSFYGENFGGLKPVLIAQVCSAVFICLSEVYCYEFISIGRPWLVFGARMIRDLGIVFIGYFVVVCVSSHQALCMALVAIVMNGVFGEGINEEVKERSKILKEAFADDAEIIIKKLMAATLRTRSLDYLRQTLIFNHVYKHTDYFKNIKYLLVDDADEMTPVCFDFISYLRPQLKDWVICFDSLGSSRCGYLSADTSIEYKLEKLFNEKPVQEGESFVQGEKIFSNILEGKQEKLENFTLTSLSKRAEILDYTIEKIQNLFKKNVLPKDIVIITPLQDDMLHFTLREKLNCNILFLSGSEKLIDNPLVKSSLNILKLMLGIEISEMDLRVILSDYIGIPLKYCMKSEI